MWSLAAIFTSFLACNAAASPAENAECEELYGMAAATAVPILPAPLHTLFEAHFATLRRAAAPGARVASGSKMTTAEPQWHYVILDIAASAADVEGRRAAARRFPRERDKAIALYESSGVHDGGLLPWVVQDRYEAAVQAFRSGEPERIVAEAGVLLHFCVDAAMPCNTATDRPRRHRDHTELFNKLKKRLEYEVRVSPDRLSPVEGAIDATFDVLLDAHQVADELITTDAAALPAEREAALEKWAARAAPILETQVETGALLAANLIAAAWAEAGKPEPRTEALIPPLRGTAIPQAVAVLYVGSRNSTVYHHPTCSHVPRIKPENRVTFDSQEQARAAGRTPCKTCKPNAPDKPPSR